ncbi:MAG: peptidylprolyl isomerase [Gammaproteobacteria bacterium]
MGYRQRLLGRILVLGLAWWLAGTPALAVEPLDRIIAVVNNDVVMASELEVMAARLAAELRQRSLSVPPDSDLRRQALDRLVFLKVQLQLAAQSGLRVDDDTLNRAVSNIAAENKMSLSDFRDAVEREGMDFNTFREDVRNEIVVTRLRQREVDNLITVSEREIDNFIATKAQQKELDMGYRIDQLRIPVPKDADEDAIEQAQALADKTLARLRGGEPFNTVARELAGQKRARRYRGPQWMDINRVPPFIKEGIRALRKGQVSEVLKGARDLYIVKLEEVRAGDRSLAVKQTRARHILIKPNEVFGPKDVQQRLRKLRSRVAAGEDFAALARSNSEDKVTAAKGGELGWVGPGDLVPQFEAVMGGLQPTEISEPFETQYGWHIVQVLQRRDYDNTQQAVRNRAREAIRRRKIEEETQAWIRRLRDEAYVELRLGRN